MPRVWSSSQTRGAQPVLGVWEALERVLNGTSKRRDRAGLAQPRAATLREKRRGDRTQRIAREKNDALEQGRILPRQDGVEGWPVQDGHMQVTHNHIIMPRLELGQGVLAIARRANAIAIPAQQAGQGADHARLIVNY